MRRGGEGDDKVQETAREITKNLKRQANKGEAMF
jgi:hypothetical protein